MGPLPKKVTFYMKREKKLRQKVKEILSKYWKTDPNADYHIEFIDRIDKVSHITTLDSHIEILIRVRQSCVGGNA